jgi:hypothetical protein
MFMRRQSRKVELVGMSTMHRVKFNDGSCRIGISSAHRKIESQRRVATKNEKRSCSNLTGGYLSTGMELVESEDIILTTISAYVHERSLVVFPRKFIDWAVLLDFDSRDVPR